MTNQLVENPVTKGTDMNRRLISIYRSSAVAEMYLYVDRQAGMEPVPAALRERFGKPELVLTMMLDAQRRLARVAAGDVLTQIAASGYYLQLPPPPVPRAESGVRADYVPLVPSERGRDG